MNELCAICSNTCKTCNIKKDFCLVDARGEKRFKGLVDEPRKNLKKGNIQGSKNLPYLNVINSENNTFKKKNELKNSLFVAITPGLCRRCGNGLLLTDEVKIRTAVTTTYNQ